MPTIKFAVNQKEKLFYKELRERVDAYLEFNGYSKHATPMHLFKAVLFFLIYWANYVLLLLGDWNDWGLILLYCCLGITGLLVAFNVSHDACHECLTPNKVINHWVYTISFNMLGTNAYLWKMRHNDSHHLFPNVDGCDADIDNNSVIRLSPHSPVKWYHAYQQYYAPLVYLIYTLHWVFYKDFHYLNRKELANMTNIQHGKAKVFGVLLAKLLYFFYIIGLPLWFHWDQWLAVLIGFIGLHFCMSYFFLFTNIINHYSIGVEFPLSKDASGQLPHNWAVHQMTTSQDYFPESKWLNFFFGGFNAHCAHHLFPDIVHVHYTAVTKIIKEMAVKYRIPYRETTWTGGLKGHFKYLREMGNPS